ncbi:uncharacterized protein DNG_07100 [Cephalotrichum gorgonifer]|uniref:CCHC-type domain-containing protein n=1 Tax=Cephalotrichum gorgonifer TaxID=2041049 RepID=A0AAE8N119_9PEZI|nr:uncharacterized protein DNG_07100 [Cephalotrichum gorgonifer]
MISGVMKLPSIRGKTAAKACPQSPGTAVAIPATLGDSLEVSVSQSSPGLTKRQRHDKEHGDTAPKSTRKKAKKTHETCGPLLTSSTPKTPGSFSGSASDTLVPRSLARHSQGAMVSSGLGLETHEHDHAYTTPDSLSVDGGGAHHAKDATFSSSKQTRNHEHGIESPSRMSRDTPCGICSSEAHATPACGLLTIYRLHGDSLQGLNDVTKGIWKVWLDNEKSTCEVTNYSLDVASPGVTNHVTKQDRIARTKNDSLYAAAKTPQDTTPPVVKSGGRTAATSRIRSQPREKDDHARGLSKSTKDRPLTFPEKETPAGERAHEFECYICHGRSHATDSCESLEIYRERGSASKGKMPAVFIQRCETWVRRKKPFEETEGTECRICRDQYHVAEDCETLALYQEYGDNSMITSDIRERCEAWLRKRRDAWLWDTGDVRDDQALDVQCNICRTNDHYTGICGLLSSYKRYGENANMSRKTRKRCRLWIQKKTSASMSAADVNCTVCDSPTHPTNECRVLDHYKTYGDDAVMTERLKERCRSFSQKEAATVAVGDFPCDICRVRDHSTDVCRVLKKYRRFGESAIVSDHVKDRCRSWMQRETTSNATGDVPCGVCGNNSRHSVKECQSLQQYRRLGERSNPSRSMMDRCRAWVGNNGVGIREGGPPPPPLCSICRKLGHFEKGCGALRTYRAHSDNLQWFTDGVRDDGVRERCRDWLEREKGEMRATLVKEEVTPRMFAGRKERGSKVVEGWELYLEFVDNVNASYLVFAPAIFFRLYDMQRRAEKLQVTEPPGNGSETFIRANVAMISRLAERVTSGGGRSARENQTGATPISGSLTRAGQEPQRIGAAFAVPEEKKSYGEQSYDHAISSKAPEVKIGQHPEQTAPPKTPKPGNREHENRVTTGGTPTRMDLDEHRRQGDAPIQIAGLATQGYRNGNVPSEAAKSTTPGYGQGNRATEDGKQKEAADHVAHSTALELSGQESRLGMSALEALRRKIVGYRQEDAPTEFWMRTSEVGRRKEAAAWNRPNQDNGLGHTPMETTRRTTKAYGQENEPPKEAVNQESIAQLKQEHINAYDFHGLTTTDAPPTGEAPAAPKAMTSWGYQREQTPGISLKRKSEEAPHEGRDLILDHPSARIRQARDSPERGCKKNPNAAKVSFGAKKRCRAWLQGEDIRAGGDDEVPAYQCGVCLAPGHGSSSCADLRVYRKFGAKTRGLPDEIMARCEEWLWRENKFRGQDRSL